MGHTKNYTKVIIPFREDLLYKEVIIKVTKALDWHIEGDIIDENPGDLEVDPTYVEKMKQDIIEEREKIKSRKEAKMLKLKDKKEKLIQERLKREDTKISKTNP